MGRSVFVLGCCVWITWGPVERTPIADSDGAFYVVPFETHTYVLFGFPINFERVFGMDTGDEMINILFVRVFDTKVFGSEGNVLCLMEKETFGAWGFVVAKFLQLWWAIFLDYFRSYHTFFIRAYT